MIFFLNAACNIENNREWPGDEDEARAGHVHVHVHYNII